MPWETRTVEETREAFVKRAQAKEKSISALCQEYGISRPTGYKWLKRSENGEGMANRSRRPFRTPNRIEEAIESRIVEMRRREPAIGAVKTRRMLTDAGMTAVPSASTINEIFRRNGLITAEASEKATPYKRFEHEDAMRSREEYRAFYNNVRPHHALGLDVPCRHYTSSPREMPQRILPWEYDSGSEVRTVKSTGYLTFQGRGWYLSEGLAHKQVALIPSGQDGVWNVVYRQFRIAQLDLHELVIRSKKIIRFDP